MGEELCEIRRQWEQKVSQTEGDAKTIAELVVSGLIYNSPRVAEGRVYLLRPIQYTHFAFDLEPGHRFDTHGIRLIERLKPDLQKAVDAANKEIDLASLERQFAIHAANSELLDIALSFGKRAKPVQNAASSYYSISEKRKPAKSKAPKRLKKEE